MILGGTLLTIHDLAVGARFLSRLPSFLRRPITPEEARTTLGRRFERREADFLDLAGRAIYARPSSPYRQLLRLAGCEYGDLEKLVHREGVEGALRTLFDQGVYLTVDEFKGRRPLIRGGTKIAVAAEEFQNPLPTVHVPVRSSGSRGGATLVPMDLASIRDHARNEHLALSARGGIRWSHALWSVPGGAAMRSLLRHSVSGSPPVRWFSQVDPAGGGLHPRYRWSARVMRVGGLLAGVPLPIPQYVALENPLPIIDWMSKVLRAGGVPHLNTFVSSAVRLCQAALGTGSDLRGVQFTLTGEPITAARLAAVRAAGADGMPSYATMEAGGRIGYGCLMADRADDFHFYDDLHALIQPGPEGQQLRLPSEALLLSSLRPTAPVILLNVSTGDQASVIQRECGCALQRLGWTTHLHTVRSFEKLTAGGMTFLDSDVIKVLEEVMPARFGGAPTHYQLVEEEGDDGRPRLRLLVHPVVGPLDAAVVAETFLAAISQGSGVERLMGLVWREGQLLRVEREAPLTTASGKILHLHVSTDAGAKTSA